MIRLGLIGAGRHGSRYLLPENTPEGTKIIRIPRGEPSRGVDGVIIATPPSSHARLTIEALKLGLPVLVEKPMALTLEDATLMAETSRRLNVPLLVAHVHLWAPEFQELQPGIAVSGARVIWGGPERDDGSCPANLDWGPHAWSMALILGIAQDAQVSTGKFPERITLVSTPDGRMYGGHSTGYPMRHLVQTFVDLICGGTDQRADLDFALEVMRRCLVPTPLR